jgi:ABC-type multidrug transport system permease subunit
MRGMFNKFAQAALVISAAVASTGAAFAQAEAQTPSISGDSWVAIAIVAGLVVLIFLLISGALSLSKRDKSDAEDSGIGIIGADDDDDK